MDAAAVVVVVVLRSAECRAMVFGADDAKTFVDDPTTQSVMTADQSAMSVTPGAVMVDPPTGRSEE
jgi:hypothetical protein